MIEWVPIKDWAFTVDQEFLALVKDEGKTHVTKAHYSKFGYIFTELCGNFEVSGLGSSTSDYKDRITHAAPLNLPKTLEEKFQEFFEKHNVSPLEARTSTCLGLLANIAKEHYEGKK